MNAFVAFFCIVFGYVFYDSFSRNINFREMLMTFLQFYSCLILRMSSANSLKLEEVKTYIESKLEF